MLAPCDIRRPKDDDRAARSSHPPLRHRRNRQRQLALQEQLGESRQTRKGEISKLDERLTPKPSSSRVSSQWKSRVKSQRKSTDCRMKERHRLVDPNDSRFHPDNPHSEEVDTISRIAIEHSPRNSASRSCGFGLASKAVTGTTSFVQAWKRTVRRHDRPRAPDRRLLTPRGWQRTGAWPSVYRALSAILPDPAL